MFKTKSHTIELTSDEALVLFDFLQRYSEHDVLKIKDQSEQRALWNLCASLETKLVEPFSADFEDLLKSAKSRLRDK